MDTTNNIHEVDISYRNSDDKLMVYFYCNHTMEQVEDFYKLASKLYDFTFMHLPEISHWQLGDNQENLTVFDSDYTERLYELFADDAKATSLLKKTDKGGRFMMTQFDVIILMMHYIKLMCPDLTWEVADVHIQKSK